MPRNGFRIDAGLFNVVFLMVEISKLPSKETSMLPRPSSDQIACLLTRGRDNEDDTPSQQLTDILNHLRTTVEEYKYLSNPEIQRRHFK